MSNQLLGSKVVIVEEPPLVRAITALPTAVLAMVGVTQRGPIGSAFFYTSFKAWVDTYGTATPDSLETWASVQAFFAEGGAFLWFARTAHYTDITQTATLLALTAAFTVQTVAATPALIPGVNAAPFDLAPSDDVSISIDGAPAETATFLATQAQITSGNPETYALANGETLFVEIDGGVAQTITFLTADFVTIGTATAAEVAVVVNNALVGGSSDDNGGSVRISSDLFGTDSSVEITGGTAAAAFGFGAVVTGTGNVANIDTVTFLEFQTVLQAAVTGLTVSEQAPAASGIPDLATTATGLARTIEITASTGVQAVTGHASGPNQGTDGVPTDTLLVEAKDPGAYGNALVVRVGDATSGEAARFNLTVLQSGTIVEVFPNVTMDDDDIEGRYVEEVVAAVGVGSLLIQVTDLDAGVAQRPANADYTLVGGDDGLVGLADSDFSGSSVSLTGLHAFDNVSGTAITLLAVPGRATAAVHNAMIQYCEVTKGGLVFAILDPPEALNALGIITYAETTAGLTNTTEHGAIYWPRVKIQNPNRSVFGTAANITVPCGGHVAGRIARTDASSPGGVYKSAAGLENGILRTVTGFEDDPDGGDRHQVVNEATRDLVYPKRINPLAPINGAISIDGTRTLRGDAAFPGVGERRAVIFIETSIKNGIQFARHRNNNRTLRKEVERSIEKFLLDQLKLGAFREDNPDDAFFVDVSDALNPTAVQLAGLLKVRVGLATNKTVDFVELSFSQNLGPQQPEEL